MMLRALILLLASSGVMAGGVLTPVESGGVFSVSVKSLREARFSKTVRQQYDFSCGSAAIATLLTHHYQTPVTEQEAFESMFAAGDAARIRREGFSLLDMKNFLARKGFQADGFVARLDTLESAQVPAIALVQENGYHHFVVIKGLRDSRVLLGDPAAGTRSLSLDAFMNMWIGGTLFVVKNHLDIARFNSDADWRAAPAAPIGGVLQTAAPDGTILRRGPNDH